MFADRAKACKCQSKKGRGFDLCYMTTKEDIICEKYPAICDLKKLTTLLILTTPTKATLQQSLISIYFKEAQRILGLVVKMSQRMRKHLTEQCIIHAMH